MQTLYIPSANTNRKELPLTSLPKTEADIEAGDNGGKTALHWAAEKGHRDVVALLLSRMDLGQIAATDKWGMTALHWAAENGHGDVVALLESWERDHPSLGKREGRR